MRTNILRTGIGRIALLGWFAISSVAAAHADGAPSPIEKAQWEARCHGAGGDFRLLFTSASGDLYEDDMRVEWQNGERRIQLPLAEALYRPRGITAPRPSLCDWVGAYATADGKTLLWLARDNRPQWETLTLVLLDPADGKVLDLRENVAPLKFQDAYTRFTIRPNATGFRLRAIRRQLTDTESDGPENAIEDWLEVATKGGRIRTRWSR